MQPTVEKRTSLGFAHWQTDMRYVLTNASPKPVNVTLLQEGLWGDTSIRSESQPSTRRSASEAQWDVSVPANGKATVTASFDSKY